MSDDNTISAKDFDDPGREASKLLSMRLADISAALDSALMSAAGGKRVGFVLTVGVDDVAQYASNVDREDIQGMLGSLLDALRDGDVQSTQHTYPPTH